MDLYIPNINEKIENIVIINKQLFNNIHIIQDTKDSFDLDSFITTIEKYEKILNNLEIELQQWTTLFKNEQTISRETFERNQRYLNNLNQQKNKIILQYIFNNYFAN
jgi:hypothetical protein